MNIVSYRRSAREQLDNAAHSPYRTTLVYLLLLYAILIPYNLFTITYTYRILDQSSGFDAITKVNIYTTFASVAPLAINLLSSMWDALYNAYALRLHQDPAAGVRALFDGLQLLGKLIWLSAQILIYTTFWMFLFIIPGFIAFYRYRFAYLILFDCPNLSASQALNLSKQLTYGRKMDLFRLDLSFLYFFLPLSIGNAVINVPYFFELSNPGMRTDILFYLAGTCIAFAVQLMFLPHHRTSLAAVYLDACRIDEELTSLSE